MESVAKDRLNYQCSSLRAGSRLASYYDSCVWFTSRRPDTQGDCVGAAGILELFACSISAVQISEAWICVTANNPQVSLSDLLVWPQRHFSYSWQLSDTVFMGIYMYFRFQFHTSLSNSTAFKFVVFEPINRHFGQLNCLRLDGLITTHYPNCFSFN